MIKMVFPIIMVLQGKTGSVSAGGWHMHSTPGLDPPATPVLNYIVCLRTINANHFHNLKTKQNKKKNPLQFEKSLKFTVFLRYFLSRA